MNRAFGYAMKSSILILVIALGLFQARTTWAEEAPVVVKRQDRNISNSMALNLMRDEKDLEFVAGVFLGISNNQDSGALAMGISGELNLYRFFGVDYFAFHDVLQGPAETLFSDTPPAGDSLQYGAFITPKLRLPITAGSFRIVPKVGAGLGTRGGLDVAFNGATAMAGVDLQFRQIVTLQFNYMRGLAGTTKRMLAIPQAADEVSQTINEQAQTFNRVGIGLTIQATPQVGFGAHYIRSQIQGFNRSLTLLQGTYRF